MSSDDEDYILFNKVYYLGCASINSPRDEEETLKTISTLRSLHQPVIDPHRQFDLPANTLPASIASCQQQIEVVLSVPRRADGNVR